MISDPHILVTGGAGFIGSWLIKHLLQTHPQATITNLDSLTYAGNLDNLREVECNPRYRFIHGSINDAALVNSLMQAADFCIHVAAQTHVDNSISGPGIFFETNALGTQVLLEAARTQGIQKFILVSTDEVYGSIEGAEKFSEQSPIQPSSPYSASKAAGDLAALAYYKTYGLPVCITRCSNNYGPNQFPEKLIPLFILNASQNKPLPVYGDGLNVRDWIHVHDHNTAVDLVMQQGQPGEVYNISAHHELDNLTITRTLLAIMQKPDSLITFVPDRLGHDRRYALDSSKIRSQLGWQPREHFTTGIAETVAWYLENPEWVQRIQRREHHQMLTSQQTCG